MLLASYSLILIVISYLFDCEVLIQMRHIKLKIESQITRVFSVMPRELVGPSELPVTISPCTFVWFLARMRSVVLF